MAGADRDAARASHHRTAASRIAGRGAGGGACARSAVQPELTPRTAPARITARHSNSRRTAMNSARAGGRQSRMFVGMALQSREHPAPPGEGERGCEEERLDRFAANAERFEAGANHRIGALALRDHLAQIPLPHPGSRVVPTRRRCRARQRRGGIPVPGQAGGRAPGRDRGMRRRAESVPHGPGRQYPVRQAQPARRDDAGTAVRPPGAAPAPAPPSRGRPPTADDRSTARRCRRAPRTPIRRRRRLQRPSPSACAITRRA